MSYPLVSLTLNLWRMIHVRHQFSPLSGEGARLHGGRWNRRGQPALYLATDPVTAVAEYYQGLPKPGTLVPYRLEAERIADLTDGAARAIDAPVGAALAAEWKAEAFLQKRDPASWQMADELIGLGAQGALVPSVQNPGGCSVVLWQWQEEGHEGQGAALELLDPDASLRPPGK